MNQNYDILLAITGYLNAQYPFPNYGIEGYFGFSFLTIKYDDVHIKYKFDWNPATEKVERSEISRTPQTKNPKIYDELTGTGVL